jgi:primosomal replication protein N
MSVNQARLSGVLVSLSVLRYTPAGVAVTTLEIDHTSMVEQAGSHRAIAFNLEATALGDAALATSHLQLGQHYAFDGFWAPAHYRTKRLSFQITQVVGTVDAASIN